MQELDSQRGEVTYFQEKVVYAIVSLRCATENILYIIIYTYN